MSDAIRDTLELKPLDEAHVTILYDNRPGTPGLIHGWGFSCILELRETVILFDTGKSSTDLSRNMEALGFSVDDLDMVFLSHQHRDHTGGVSALAGRGLDVYVPSGFPKSLLEALTSMDFHVHELPAPKALSGAAASTGTMGHVVGEHSLMVRVGDGLLLVTGCAHQGVLEAVDRAKRLTGLPVKTLLGGMHMFDMPPDRALSVVEGLKAMGVERVVPCHCTGSRSVWALGRFYDLSNLVGHVGMRVRVSL